MNLRRSIAGAAVAVAVLAATALGGAAQSTSTTSVTIGSGAFTATITATNFANLPYSLVDQTARNGQIKVLVNDQTGDGDGWQVRVSVTDFVGQTRPAQIIPYSNLTVTAQAITSAVDGSQAVSLAQMPVTQATASFLWTANPGYGQGGYFLDLTADLVIPGRTTAQTYTSTATLAIVAGP